MRGLEYRWEEHVAYSGRIRKSEGMRRNWYVCFNTSEINKPLGRDKGP
jgi:hypothetical protein